MSIQMKKKDDTGEIWLYDSIGESDYGGTSAKSFQDQLSALGNVRILNIMMNSPGGSVFEGVAIYNVLRRHRARKQVHVDGLAASIASVIAMAGDNISIAENAMMMIHDPWSMAIGTAEEFRKQADVLDTIRNTLVSTYVARTGQEVETVSAMMSSETWMDGREAVEKGFADELTEPVAMAALHRYDLKMFNYKNLPSVVEEQKAKPHPIVTEVRARFASRFPASAGTSGVERHR